MSDKDFQPIITNKDIDRLELLLSSFGDSTLGLLEKELDRASLVQQQSVPADVVTMNSIVSFIDINTSEEMRMALVYPNNADATKGRISVLAPLGAALLGLRVGQTFEFRLPNGNSRSIRVTSVDFQPEAYGAFDL